MRKLLICLFFYFSVSSATAQLAAALGGNYSRFMGDYQQGSFGYLARMLYEVNKYGVALTVADQIPFRKPITPDTNLEFRPLSIDIAIRRRLAGSDTKTNLYGALGGSWAMVRYQERRNPNATMTMSALASGQTRYITANATIGAEYHPGIITFFVEGMFAQPFSKDYINGNINSIAPKLVLQLGIKLPFNNFETAESAY